MLRRIPLCFVLIGLTIATGSVLIAQEKRPPDSESTTLIPSAIKDHEVTLDLKDRKLTVRVQYAVQGQTIFLLPVWAPGTVERIIDGKSSPCKPDERIIPADEKRLVRLNVVVRNLLETPEYEKTIIEQIRQRVIDQKGLDTNAKFQVERPNINPTGIRFTLIGSGRGDESSPAEIAVSNPVSRPPDGILNFTLDLNSVRKIEKDRALAGGLAFAALTIQPTGPMQVRFERLEMDAQVRYLRSALDDFRKRVGSSLNSSTGLAPDVIVPLNGGTAESRNQLRSMLVQSLQVTVSTRQGASELPLMPLLEKAIDTMLDSSKLDAANDQQRVTFLMENQVTFTATLGEIKRLAKLDEKGRAEAFSKASDHYYATRRSEASNYSGSLNVGFKLLGGGVSGSYGTATSDGNEQRTKEEQAQQKAAFDKLMTEFDGKVPTLTGIQIDDETLTASSKKLETRFEQKSFFVDYTLHRFTPLSLAGNADVGVTLSDLLRNYSILKSDFDQLQKLLGTPKQVTEMREEMEKIKLLSEELKKKNDTLDKAITTFEKSTKESLEKIDSEAIGKLHKELEKLKALEGRANLPMVFSGTYSTTDSRGRFITLFDSVKTRTLELSTGYEQTNYFAVTSDRKLALLENYQNNNTSSLYSLTDYKTIATCQGTSGYFSTDGKNLITTDNKGVTHLYDTSTGKELGTIKSSSMSFPPGIYGYTSDYTNYKMTIYDRTTGTEKGTCSGVFLFASEDGSRVVTSHYDSTTSLTTYRIYDPSNAKLLFETKEHIVLFLSRDGKTFVRQTRKDNSCSILLTDTGEEKAKLKAPASYNLTKTNTLISLDYSVAPTKAYLYDASTGEEKSSYSGIFSGTNTDRTIFVVGVGAKTKVYDAETGKEKLVLDGTFSRVSKDGKTFATTSFAKVTIWNKEGEKVSEIPALGRGGVNVLSLSDEGQFLAYTAGSETFIWNTKTQSDVVKFHNGFINFTPDSKHAIFSRGGMTYVFKMP